MVIRNLVGFKKEILKNYYLYAVISLGHFLANVYFKPVRSRFYEALIFYLKH